MNFKVLKLVLPALVGLCLGSCSSSTDDTTTDAGSSAEVSEDVGSGQSCRIDKECEPEADCRTGVCNTTTKQCEFTTNEGTCFVDGVCYDQGDLDPTNACRACDATAESAEAQTTFTYLPNRASWVSQPNEDGTGNVCTDPCVQYCDSVNSACRNDLAQYVGGYDSGNIPTNAGQPGGLSECLSYCVTWQNLPAEGPNADRANNVLCRLDNAVTAAKGEDDALLHCPAAGPSGGGLCGSWCENYCQLAIDNCSMFESMAECLPLCEALPQDGAAGDTEGDSVQCRIYYVGGVKLGQGSCAEGAINNSTKCRAAAAPQGDSCSQPLVVTSTPFVGSSTTKGANSSYRSACPAEGTANDTDPDSGSPDQAWRLETAGQLSYTVTLTPDFDATLYVLQGECGGLTCVSVPIDVDAKQTRSVSFEPPSAGTYYIIVDGREALPGDTAPTGSPPSGTYTLQVKSGPTCTDYCAAVTTACTGTDAQFVSPEACHAYCSTMAATPPGSTSDSSGNTVGCRMLYAVKALALVSNAKVCGVPAQTIAERNAQVAEFCTRAGKTGGDICGGLCENYCYLAEQRCSGQPGFDFGSGASKCINSCNAIKEVGVPGAQTGQSRHCLFTYISHEPELVEDMPPVADLSAEFCAQASLVSALTGTEGAPCTNECIPECSGKACGPDGCGGVCGSCSGTDICNADGVCEPDCQRYCDQVTCNCTGEQAQFEDMAKCQEFCTEFTKVPEEPEGATPNSLDCLTFHATRAATWPAQHCEQAGQATSAQCTDLCTSYCAIMGTNCTGNNAKFADVGECLTACATIPALDTALTSKNHTDADTLQCRLHYAVQAGIKDGTVSVASQCDHAAPASTNCASEEP